MTGDATSSNVASCFVRVGNTLLYPYINSFGWSATGYEYPTPCKNSTVLSNPAAKYFCSKCCVCVCVFGVWWLWLCLTCVLCACFV